jgi:hypothetical protein
MTFTSALPVKIVIFSIRPKKHFTQAIVESVRLVDQTIESNLKIISELIKANEFLEKISKKPPTKPYTALYGLTYDEWIDEKAKRIRDCLRMFYTSNMPLDIQTLAELVYRERLRNSSKLYWMPIKGAFTNSKPSPFIKKFITYLINKLVEDGYIVFGWQIEIYDKIRVFERTVDTTKSRIYSIGLWQKILEVSDNAKLLEWSFETSLQPVKVKRYWKYIYLEIREVMRVGEARRALETIANPPKTKTIYAKHVLKIPTLYYLKDLCKWKKQ